MNSNELIFLLFTLGISLIVLLIRFIVKNIIFRGIQEKTEDSEDFYSFLLLNHLQHYNYGYPSYFMKFIGGIIYGSIMSLIFSNHILNLQFIGNVFIIILRTISGILVAFYAFIHFKNVYSYLEIARSIKSPAFSAWTNNLKIGVGVDIIFVLFHLTAVFLPINFFLLYLPMILLNGLNTFVPATSMSSAQKMETIFFPKSSVKPILKSIFFTLLLFISLFSSYNFVIQTFRFGYNDIVEQFFSFLYSLSDVSRTTILSTMLNGANLISPFFGIALLYSSFSKKMRVLEQKYFQGNNPPLTLSNTNKDSLEISVQPIVLRVLLEPSNAEKYLKLGSSLLYFTKIGSKMDKLDETDPRISLLSTKSKRIFRLLVHSSLHTSLEIITGLSLNSFGDSNINKILDKNHIVTSKFQPLDKQNPFLDYHYLESLTYLLNKYYQAFCTDFKKYTIKSVDFINGLSDILYLVLLSIVAYPIISFYSTFITTVFLFRAFKDRFFD